MTARSGEYLLAAGVTPGRLREALQPRFDLDAGSAVTVERAYFDTFDGLLHQAGVTLVWEAGRLVLIDGHDGEAAAADWPRPAAPVRVADVPGGPLHDHLQAVIDVRAASPLVRVRMRRRTLAVLDGQRKTVARLAIDEPSVAADQGRLRLAGRLSLTGVRGYDKALAQVHRVVESELGLAAAGESLADEAVRSAGGTPGGVSSNSRSPWTARSVPTPPRSRSSPG